MKKLILGIMGFLLFACSNDNDVNTNDVNANEESGITGFKTIRESQYYLEGKLITSKTVILGVVENGKLISETADTFLNDEKKSQGLGRNFIYENGMFVK